MRKFTSPSSRNSRNKLLLIWYFQDIKQLDESILSVQAGINKPPFLVMPLRKSTVIKGLFGILDDKWDDPVVKTFLQCDQSADSPVSVLKRVNVFEVGMKPDHIVYCDG